MTATQATPRPLGALGTTLESARQTLSSMRRRRVWLWFVLLVGVHLPAAMALTRFAPDKLDGADLYCLLMWWSFGTVVVPWTTIYLGVHAVHSELEDRTCQYLFLRPVGRPWLLLGKWLAVSLAAAALASVGAFVVFQATADPERWRDGLDPGLMRSFCVVLSLGAVAYAAVAVVFATTFRRPLAWAAFFVVGVQMLIANLPVSAGLRRLTITDPMRRLVFDLIEPDGQLVQILWPAERALKDDEIGAPIANLLYIVAACLVFAAWRYSRTEYESRNRD